MKAYNYYEVLESDIRECVENWYDLTNYDNIDNAYENLYDDLWIDDSVTGNGSGSYTFSTFQAEENLCHNLDLLAEACNDFGQSLGEAVECGAEFCDVTIRCYLVGGVLYDVLEDINEENNYWK